MFGYTFGGPELIIVALITLVLFGNRLPSVMRSLGRSVTEFKKGVQGIEQEIDQASVTVDTSKPTTTTTTTNSSHSE